MKALSLIQPWATLIAVGAKAIETRSWPTEYRGPIAIHASKWLGADGRIVNPDVRDCLEYCYLEPFCSVLTRAGIGRVRDLPSGAVVATARLVDVVRTDGLDVDPLEREFGNFAPGRWAWRLDGVCRLATPIPYRGNRGLWDLPDEVLAVQTSAQENEPTR